ncbi:MAG: hypothetical protein ACI8ZN_001147 [Bacteroidia bacterium]|jgi:hypothetical protein
MRIITLGLAFLTICFTAFGQSTIDPCASHQYIDHLDSLYPGFRKAADQTYLHAISETKQTDVLNKAKPLDTIYTLQVVFHVVWFNNEHNIHDSLITTQLKTINDAFNRRNADTVNMRDLFKSVAGNSRIEFVLAKTDPDGNPTNGITRTKTYRSTFNASGSASQQDYIKSESFGGVAAWNSDKYLNIWIGNLNLSNGNRSLFGYAYPPVNEANWPSTYYVGKDKQGVVLHYEVVGENNPAKLARGTYTIEKTAVHEVGHYLGLRHIWGDAPWGVNGCTVDDYIDDTPNTGSRTTSCSWYPNTCTMADDMPDQIENYMDYSPAYCTNMFTAQQIRVMRYNLVNLRPGLAESKVVFEEEEEEKVIANSEFWVPNPIKQSLHLNAKSTFAVGDVISIKVYDLYGRLVFEGSGEMMSNQATFKLNFLAVGIYDVSFTSALNGKIGGWKVVKVE